MPGPSRTVVGDVNVEGERMRGGRERGKRERERKREREGGHCEAAAGGERAMAMQVQVQVQRGWWCTGAEGVPGGQPRWCWAATMVMQPRLKLGARAMEPSLAGLGSGLVLGSRLLLGSGLVLGSGQGLGRGMGTGRHPVEIFRCFLAENCFHAAGGFIERYVGKIENEHYSKKVI
jgi:hypothetical protein